MIFLNDIQPPYTNRWGAVPGAAYVRCNAITLAGNQCRACAAKGHKVCGTHLISSAPAPTQGNDNDPAI